MFFLEYLRHPVRVGAIAPSGKPLARKMMEPVDFENARVIVEYGPGTGAFTREILARKRPETRLICIEQNDTFFQEISALCRGAENVTVVHGSAEEADILAAAQGCPQADAVISGLPFTSLPKMVSLRIFGATQRLIGEKGAFITFQYTRLMEAFFLRHFALVNRLRVKINLPPAYVYVLKTKQKEARA